MKKSIKLFAKSYPIIGILFICVTSVSVNAQTFSCPYTIDNSGFNCPITIGWSINCSSPASCASCNFGQITVPPNSTATIPTALCNACLTGCTGCDIKITLLRINAIPVSSPPSVSSTFTTNSDPANTTGCCPAGQLPTLFWYSSSTRIICQ